jgi:hypothetical protein
LCGFILFPLFVHQVNAIIPFGVAALAIGLYTFFHPGLRAGAEDPEAAGADTGVAAAPLGAPAPDRAANGNGSGPPGGPPRPGEALSGAGPGTPNP